MSKIDNQGNIHNNLGQFAGHVPTSAEVRLAEPAISDREFDELNDTLRGAQALLDAAREAQAIAARQVIAAAAKRNYPDAAKVTFIEHWDGNGDVDLESIEDQNGNVIVDGDRDLDETAWSLVKTARRIDRQDLGSVFDEADNPEGNVYELDLSKPVGRRWSPGDSLNLTTLPVKELSRLHFDVAEAAGQVAAYASIGDLEYRLYDNPHHYGFNPEQVAKAEALTGGKDALLRALTETSAWGTMDELVTEKVSSDYAEGTKHALNEILNRAAS
ncbi:hypothetical protein ACFVAJ_16675 [Agromyces sp. NPDC057679]|uniref:hypothetical protein n=1 Tax=Agromyces sp. NPDC057679 TaxID=3346207 RepID=UPI00366F1F69